MEWYKSSYSSNYGNCVEIAQVPGGRAVRDSKNPEGGTLTFSHAEWSAFIGALKTGEPR
ncbi:MAG: DUF397 domain-containing protein [Pseudonocardiaceae bacterium]